jgi:hypothetical protein
VDTVLEFHQFAAVTHKRRLGSRISPSHDTGPFKNLFSCVDGRAASMSYKLDQFPNMSDPTAVLFSAKIAGLWRSFTEMARTGTIKQFSLAF